MLAEAEAELKPASQQSMAVAIDQIMKFGVTFKIPAGNVKDATQFFGAGLAGLPEDLLQAAVLETLQGCKFGNRLPLPGELRACVTERMGRRARRLARVRWAQQIVARRTLEAAERLQRQQEREAKWAKTEQAKGGKR